MSTTEPDVDTVLVAGRSSGRVPALHIPGKDGRPICDTFLHDKQDHPGNDSGPRSGEDRWREKDIAVYPEGWRTWCKRCQKQWGMR